MVAALPTFRDGVITTAANLNALAANVTNLYAVAAGGKTSAKPQLILRVTGTRAIANNTDTAVIWDVADRNNDTMWSSGATVTIKTAGTWRINCTVGFDSATFGDGAALALTVNGTTTSSQSVAFWHDTSSTRARAAAVVTLAANATVTAVVNQKSGVSRNLALTQGGCRFDFTYLGAV